MGWLGDVARTGEHGLTKCIDRAIPKPLEREETGGLKHRFGIGRALGEALGEREAVPRARLIARDGVFGERERERSIHARSLETWSAEVNGKRPRSGPFLDSWSNKRLAARGSARPIEFLVELGVPLLLLRRDLRLLVELDANFERDPELPGGRELAEVDRDRDPPGVRQVSLVSVAILVRRVALRSPLALRLRLSRGLRLPPPGTS